MKAMFLLAGVVIGFILAVVYLTALVFKDS